MNIKSDFPIFKSHPSLIYLDNAATTQKPSYVLDVMHDFYAHDYASAYRGMYGLAENATERYEKARHTVAEFIGAYAQDIAFTSNATEAINIVASSWAQKALQPGDEIVLSELEHHANILPWQRLARERGVILRWLRVNFDGSLVCQSSGQALGSLINSATKLIALTGYSNVLGSLDVLAGQEDFLKDISTRAHAVGAKVLIDAAQMAPNTPINVYELGCDFLVFSGHKLYGPRCGVLYVAPHLQNSFEAYNLGGGIVTKVTHDDALFRPFPHILEAGTQSVVDVIGLAAALDYCKSKGGIEKMSLHARLLAHEFVQKISRNSKILILGPQPEKSSVVSFIIDGIHAHDVAAYLDTVASCAVRASNHCAQILHQKMGIVSSVRVSFAAYNTAEEVDTVCNALCSL